MMILIKSVTGYQWCLSPQLLASLFLSVSESGRKASIVRPRYQMFKRAAILASGKIPAATAEARPC